MTADMASCSSSDVLVAQFHRVRRFAVEFDMLVTCRFPMAGPSGATLQATKRGSRYWALRSQVQAAIAVASGRSTAEVRAQSEPHEAVGILEVGHSSCALINPKSSYFSSDSGRNPEFKPQDYGSARHCPPTNAMLGGIARSPRIRYVFFSLLPRANSSMRLHPLPASTKPGLGKGKHYQHYQGNRSA